MSGQSFSKAFLISTLVGAGALVATPSLAEVRHVGDWRVDPEVTLDLDRTPRDEAVKRLAAAAGWSLVSTVPPGEPVDIHVRHQRAGKILALLLTDGDYVVTRGDGLLAVSRLTPGQAWPAAAHGSGALPPLPPLPPLSPLPPIPPLSGIAAPAEPVNPVSQASRSSLAGRYSFCCRSARGTARPSRPRRLSSARKAATRPALCVRSLDSSKV